MVEIVLFLTFAALLSGCGITPQVNELSEALDACDSAPNPEACADELAGMSW